MTVLQMTHNVAIDGTFGTSLAGTYKNGRGPMPESWPIINNGIGQSNTTHSRGLEMNIYPFIFATFYGNNSV